MICPDNKFDPNNIVLLWSVDGSEFGSFLTQLHMMDWDKDRKYKVEIQCFVKTGEDGK